jgi:hypothetical protein
MSRSLFCLGAMIASVCAADWKDDVAFRAKFDGSLDASVGSADRKLYSAPSYKELAGARAGLDGTDVSLAKGVGHSGDALRFAKKNEKAVFYRAQGNIPFDPKNWSGTLSFWLQLDPDQDLAPGYCDPIQLTDKEYNDSAMWVDFTKDDKPRHFRLGVFGKLKEWNPTDIPPDKNPAFPQRLVIVKKTPFARGKWTHVAITYDKLGSGSGEGKLYLDGKLQGTTPKITEGFEWNPANGTLRLGVNYVGLLDDVSVFRRPLTASEVQALSSAKW